MTDAVVKLYYTVFHKKGTTRYLFVENKPVVVN